MQSEKIIKALKKAVKLLKDADRDYARATLKYMEAAKAINMLGFESSMQEQTLSLRLTVTMDALYYFNFDEVALNIRINI